MSLSLRSPLYRRVSKLAEALELRNAEPCDSATIVQISTGPIANKESFIVDSFGRRTVIGAYRSERLVGYAIWDRAFFGRPFVWLLGVAEDCRRCGIAARLLGAFERACPGEATFTSTNESNVVMQAVLARAGFVRSGWVENLDPGDPELFYYKAAVKE